MLRNYIRNIIFDVKMRVGLKQVVCSTRASIWSLDSSKPILCSNIVLLSSF